MQLYFIIYSHISFIRGYVMSPSYYKPKNILNNSNKHVDWTSFFFFCKLFTQVKLELYNLHTFFSTIERVEKIPCGIQTLPFYFLSLSSALTRIC